MLEPLALLTVNRKHRYLRLLFIKDQRPRENLALGELRSLAESTYADEPGVALATLLVEYRSM